MHRSPAYCLGVAVGIAVAVAFLLILKKLLWKKRTKAQREYDERQQQALGRAYKYGYYTLLLYLGAAALFDLMTGIRWCSLYTGAFLGVLLSVAVFGLVGIANDAYFPFRDNPKRYIALFAALGAMNVALGVVHWCDAGTFLEDGVLSHSAINPLAGVLLLALAAAMLIKVRRDKRAMETESGE